MFLLLHLRPIHLFWLESNSHKAILCAVLHRRSFAFKFLNPKTKDYVTSMIDCWLCWSNMFKYIYVFLWTFTVSFFHYLWLSHHYIQSRPKCIKSKGKPNNWCYHVTNMVTSNLYDCNWRSTSFHFCNYLLQEKYRTFSYNENLRGLQHLT